MANMRLAWCTDIHLDCLHSDEKVKLFAEHVRDEYRPDGVMLTGDTSTGPNLTAHLGIIERAVGVPVFFVAGNHDFYGTSIGRGRSDLATLCAGSRDLNYMSAIGHVSATDSTAIVGHDGWYDARNGDWRRTNFVMTDWYEIADFSAVAPWNNVRRGAKMDGIIEVARGFARRAAEHVAASIDEAAKDHRSIVVITHFPPWSNVVMRRGSAADAGTLPWYSSRVMGRCLDEAASAHPSVDFTVLCGHAHGQYSAQIARNMRCFVGGAEYGKPRVQCVIDVK